MPQQQQPQKNQQPAQQQRPQQDTKKTNPNEQQISQKNAQTGWNNQQGDRSAQKNVSDTNVNQAKKSPQQSDSNY